MYLQSTDLKPVVNGNAEEME